MKILFIMISADFVEPHGIMQLSAVLKSRGHQTFLCIANKDDIFKKIKEIRPHVIAYSSCTGEHKTYLRINEKVKKSFPGIFTIMGGPHPTFYPDCIHRSSLDAICRGEGDEAFPEFLEHLEDPGDVPNITTKDKSNPPRHLCRDLDALPFPDRDIFYEATGMSKYPLKFFILSRGCPYGCTYCFNHAMRKLYEGKGEYVRRKSVTRSIEEILYTKKKYPLEFVKFYDDIFIYPHDQWLNDFCREYKKQIKLPFHCLVRLDIVDEDSIRMVKEAGCVSACAALETGSSFLRNKLLQKNITDEQIYSAVELFHRHEIKLYLNNMLALPDSRISDDIRTIDMNIKCKPAFAEFFIMQPYPGTKIGEYCKEKGFFSGDYDEIEPSFMSKSKLTCFTKREKMIQKNLSYLGTIVVLYPSLKNIIFNFLIYLPNNIFYFLIFIAAKGYLVKTKLYNLKFKNPLEFVRAAVRGVNIEALRHTEKG